MVEMPIRLSLRSFARAVDVECVVQDTLVQMWIRRGEGCGPLGENASLRYAIEAARDVARSQASRTGCEALLPHDDVPELELPPDMEADLALRKAMLDCFNKLEPEEEHNLRWRMELGWVRDVHFAEKYHMTTAALSETIARARKRVVRCLAQQGIKLEGYDDTQHYPTLEEESEVLPEAAVSARREEDPEGCPIPAPEWLCMTPESRARLFRLQLVARRMERVYMYSGTQVIVTLRIGKMKRASRAANA